jgi:hypothetical protein
MYWHGTGCTYLVLEPWPEADGLYWVEEIGQERGGGGVGAHFAAAQIGIVCLEIAKRRTSIHQPKQRYRPGGWPGGWQLPILLN